MSPSRVKIFNPNGEGRLGTQFEIDGKKMTGVRSVDFHISEVEVQQFTFEMYGMPDIDMLGDVTFQFTPKTVQEAAAVIRKEFHYSSDYFKAMAHTYTGSDGCFQKNTGRRYRETDTWDINHFGRK